MRRTVANRGLEHANVMGSSDASYSNVRNAPLPPTASIDEGAKEIVPVSTPLRSLGVEKVSADQLLSIPLAAFYENLPKQLLTSKKPDLSRSICFGRDDLVSDEKTKEAKILLSILSLSCPEIFARPIQAEDDVTIAFPLSRLEPGRLEQQLRMDTALEENTKSPGAGVPFEDAGGGSEAEAKAASARTADEIRLKLEPILSNLPPEFELPPFVNDPQMEIALPANLVKDQLKNGRVSLDAAAFCALLPENLKHLFENIEPTAEVPIPVREIFPKLPSDTIKLREDYELAFSQEAIRTPFTLQAEEDAVRRGIEPGSGPVLEPDRATQTSANIAQEKGEMDPGIADSGIARFEPPPSAGISFPHSFDSHTLQALFMTEEVLDLPGTVKRLGELPGLRGCILATKDGKQLAGKLVDPWNEILLTSPRLFRQVASTFKEMHFPSPDCITLYCDQDSLSIFSVDDFMLAVLHDNRPLRPGVREKIMAAMQELGKISRTRKQPGPSNASP